MASGERVTPPHGAILYTQHRAEGVDGEPKPWQRYVTYACLSVDMKHPILLWYTPIYERRLC